MLAQITLRNIFQRQKIMRKVLISLIPVTLGGMYFFGLRLLCLLVVVMFAAVATEYFFAGKRKAKVTEAVLVSSVLFTLSLPVSTPFWAAALGIFFGIFFGKEVFGGFGHNVFNPAIVGRTFILVSFPGYLTAAWTQIFTTFPGGFARYIAPPLDTLTQATPLALFQAGETLPLSQVIVGNVFGTMGETSVLLLLLGGIFLLVNKAADWRLMLSPMLGFLGLTSVLKLAGVGGIPHPLYGLFTGGFFFLCIYFVTEPVTAPKTIHAKWLYGILIGVITVIIRYFGIFAEGASFALLIMNIFVPLLDDAVKSLQALRKKEAAA
ncbi:MAG: RnfABCDGE type electron transport complex subunit D [Firmicutes bacterium]|nr:RnfABCDGE type electron transport complex subunit D [Bacillota bacterium]